VSEAASTPSHAPRGSESAAYFACIEAVQNALRHSGSSRITVDVECEPSTLRLTVTDDGCGFDTDLTAGSGLEGIKDRVGSLGGRAQVRSAPGAGTRVLVSLPATAPRAQPSTSAR